MNQLSEKELSAVSELLTQEELLVKKFQMLAGHATDPDVKREMEDISHRHQSHFNQMYSFLG